MSIITKIPPIKMTFEEFSKQYNDNKYLYCETLTGEWFYKNIETGKDLPMYSQPILRRSDIELREKYEEFIEKGIIERSNE